MRSHLYQIDFDKADIDIDRSSSVTARHIRSRENRQRSSSRKRHRPKNTEGREKFARRRRIKRLNRLLKRAERDGMDLSDYISEEEPSTHVSAVDSDTVEVVIDEHPVDVEFDESTLQVELLHNGNSTAVELPAVPIKLRKKTERNSITTLLFQVESEEI